MKKIIATRRNFLKTAGLFLLNLTGCRLYPDQGIWNLCLSPASIPQDLLNHEIVQAAWNGLDPTQVWDSHVHMVGTGDGDSGMWLNPDSTSPLHPVQNIQRKFFMNAGCAEQKGDVDKDYLKHLFSLLESFPKGAKGLLLAFDYTYCEEGKRLPDLSTFYVPNKYVREVAERYPQRLEWIASIHPYRKDAVQALEEAIRNGTRAIKWLPPAMGINPDSPLCDPFYETLAKWDIPLLTHGGQERAVHGANREEFGNPQLLRRALDHKVRVIVAHCASMGTNVDLEKGKKGPQEENFKLFSKMMEERQHEGFLFGDISAITQSNRVETAVEEIILKTEWHPRLLNGSDYPLPGVMPLYSMDLFVNKGLIKQPEADLLSQIRQYNPLLFDFVLKRTLRVQEKRLSDSVFQTSEFFRSKKSLS